MDTLSTVPEKTALFFIQHFYHLVPTPAEPAGTATCPTDLSMSHCSHPCDQGLPVPDGAVISPEAKMAEPLSKKGQKKAAKAFRYAEQKAERRAREKERKKLKRAAAQPELHDEDGAAPQSKRIKLCPSPKIKFSARLVIDLGFDDKMTEKVPNLN